jgi:hypothetical protein
LLTSGLEAFSGSTNHQQFILAVMIPPIEVVAPAVALPTSTLLAAAAFFFVVTFAIRTVGLMVTVLSFCVRLAIFTSSEEELTRETQCAEE